TRQPLADHSWGIRSEENPLSSLSLPEEGFVSQGQKLSAHLFLLVDDNRTCKPAWYSSNIYGCGTWPIPRASWHSRRDKGLQRSLDESAVYVPRLTSSRQQTLPEGLPESQR